MRLSDAAAVFVGAITFDNHAARIQTQTKMLMPRLMTYSETMQILQTDLPV